MGKSILIVDEADDMLRSSNSEVGLLETYEKKLTNTLIVATNQNECLKLEFYKLEQPFEEASTPKKQTMGQFGRCMHFAK